MNGLLVTCQSLIR